MAKSTTSHGDYRKRVGLRVAELRAAKGLSQRKLALVLEMDRVTLNRIEAGKANPTIGTLERIAGGLEVNVEELLSV